jgi:putative Mg2+ transporter-C (MgtC) family protein
LLGRIALAALLGFVVGWEREFRGRAAGERTFALVSLGAASFMALGAEFFRADTGKVMEGIAVGVGFLGTGLIFRAEGRGVVGLTTAASVWASAAVGTLVGGGELLLGALVTILLLVVLELEHVPIVRRFDPEHRPGRREQQE